jgi:hypothetical protein
MSSRFDRVTERDCQFCDWSGPSNKYYTHLPECPGTDAGSAADQEADGEGNDTRRELA